VAMTVLVILDFVIICFLSFFSHLQFAHISCLVGIEWLNAVVIVT